MGKIKGLPQMGISHTDLFTVLKLRESGELPLRFAVADIGAQQLNNSILNDAGLFEALAKAFKVPYRMFGTPIAVESPGAVEILPEGAPSARAMWEWLGCNYVAFDIDRSPGTVALDLNFDEVPRQYRAKFHLVTNFGTTEHVANQSQAMKVIHDLTAPQGIMLHNVPVQGYANHGLINYNAKFFWMLARSCRYRWLDFHFSTTEQALALPDDILKQIQAISPERAEIASAIRVMDSAVFCVFQKRENIAYVCPADFHSNGVTDDKRIRRRYRSVISGSDGGKLPDRSWLASLRARFLPDL